MIDKEMFAQGMGQLGGAFGREIDGPVSKMYYGILSPKLTTEEWTLAVTRTLETETFWPSPAVVLAKVKDAPEEQAAAALSVVRRVLNSFGQLRDVPGEAVKFDAPTWAGLKEIGGLRNARDEKYEKRFVRGYANAILPRPAIEAGGKPDKKVLELVRETGRALALPPGDR